MSELNIRITETDTGENKDIGTSGYLLFYFEADKIKSQGNIGIKTLTPILSKLLLEKLSKW